MATPKQATSGHASIATAPRFVKQVEADALDQAIRERIADRAYQLYEQAGYRPGHDQEHWLAAESEVLRRGLEVRESGSWMAVHGSLPEVAAEDVNIYVDSRRIIIRATKQRSSAAGYTETADRSAPETFLVAELTVEVEPATTSAALKDGKLTLMVKKRFPSPVLPIAFASEG